MGAAEFIITIFHGLEENHISYAILRKADEVVAGAAHDIDMALDFACLTDALALLERTAAEFGWKRILATEKDLGNLRAVHYAKIGEGKPEIIHFDLFRNFSWNGSVLLDNAALLADIRKQNGVFCVSREKEIVIKFLSRLIYHGYVKEEYREEIRQFVHEHGADFQNELSACIGAELSGELISLIKNENWEKIGTYKREIRNAAVKKNGEASKLSTILFQFKRFLSPGGVMIAFLGTDGSGKSTIIENLPAYIGNTFNASQTKYYHWRPDFLKSPKGEKSGSKGDTSTPHQQKPYGKLVSFLKFSYFNLDYVLGYWFDVKKHLGKNELVIFDRYYYDYMLDKYRYRFDLPDSIISFCRHFIPKPDITFLLTGDPEILYARKKELPVEELKRQIVRLNHVATEIPNSILIDVNQNIDGVVTDVSNEILSHMAYREKKNTR